MTKEIQWTVEKQTPPRTWRRRSTILWILLGLVLAPYLLVTVLKLESTRRRQVFADAGAILKVGPDGETIVAVNFADTDIGTAIAQKLAEHQSISRLAFGSCHIEAGVLPLLAQLPRLSAVEFSKSTWESIPEWQSFLSSVPFQSIYFEDMNIGDEELQLLDTRRLMSATLNDCEGLSQDGISFLADRPPLRCLNCTGTLLNQRTCRRLRSTHEDLLLTVSAADIVELQQYLNQGMELQIDQDIQVVKLNVVPGKAELTPASFDPFPDLQHLTIHDAHVSEQIFEAIGDLQQLQSLSLESSRLSARGILHLERNANLHVLNLDGVVTDEGRGIDLPSLPRLRELHACTREISLAKLRQLESDELQIISIGPEVTGEQLLEVARFQQLQTVALYGSTVDESMHQCLAPLKSLRYLFLYDCDIVDGQLEGLIDGVGVSTLHLMGSEVTAATVERLRDRSPSVNVIQSRL